MGKKVSYITARRMTTSALAIMIAAGVPVTIAPVGAYYQSEESSPSTFIILCNEKTRKTLVYEMIVNNRIVEV